MNGLSEHVTRALLAPVGMLTDPDERIYWLFLLSSVVLATLVAWRAPEHGRASLRELLGARLWTHTSSWLDIKLLVTKTVGGALFAGGLVGSAHLFAARVVGFLDGALGGPPSLEVPPLVVGVVYTVVLFVAWDLSRYLLHRLMHEVPALWELHKVHHSAEVLTPLTLYRVHPLESVLYQLRGVVVTGTVAGAFFFLFRERAVELEVLGINAFGFVFNLLGSNLRHTDVWLSFGPRVERHLMSPAQHQIHHSQDPAHFGKNYGTWLALWDRLGRSLVVTERKKPPLTFGLAPGERNHEPGGLVSSLVGPVLALARAPFRRGAPR